MNRGRLWIGLMLVALGVVFLLQQFGYTDGGAIVGSWWPVALITLGLLSFAGGGVLAPLILTIVGLALLAATLGLLAFTFAVLWPLIVLAIGISFLAGGFAFFRRPALDANRVDQLALFSGFDIRSVAQQFRGGSLTAIFGGFTLDLHEAHLAPEGARLQATTMFGGMTILVPAGWRVTMTGLPIFGGFSDKTKVAGPTPEDAPHLHVDTVALFGGVEVKLYEAGKPWPAAAAA